MGAQPSSPRAVGTIILLILSDHHEALEHLLRIRGYTVVVPSTADQAVAICLHNQVAAVLIDDGTLEDVQDWSLAKSVKAVSPHTQVLFMSGADSARRSVIEGVDRLVDWKEPWQVLDAIRKSVA